MKKIIFNECFEISYSVKDTVLNFIVIDIYNNENYINGFIKWDGCCHFNFGDHDGYLHICGKIKIKDHVEIVNKIYNLAEKELKIEA